MGRVSGEMGFGREMMGKDMGLGRKWFGEEKWVGERKCLLREMGF